ncbi:hypothetical protein ACHHYP_15681 [Achlya hypogyna]|uniref:Uncharacterized protein n=1 Tax=Achlya hypogyna TaxID=1202772 RepID=A0A1V9YAG4_ACHHY|nr:hypothetical protein ACHHYP_15681 [Achlya hypogyna]
MSLASLTLPGAGVRQTLQLRYCSQVVLLDEPRPKSRVMQKLENVQATLGCPLVINRSARARTMSTLPKLNKHNNAEVVLPAPNLVRTTTAPVSQPRVRITAPPVLTRSRTAEL